MKHKILLLDPPYLFRNFTEKKHGSPKKHYNGLTIEQLCKLPIGEIADDNAVMFLWIPCTKIVDGAHLELFNAWNFKPVTLAFCWRKIYKSGKPYTGLGFWCRNDVELCLLGKRGKISRKSNNVKQTIEAPVLKPHSTKPAIFRDKMVELVGDLPRIEIFARPPIIIGWSMVGYEITGRDIKEDLDDIISGKDIIVNGTKVA